MKKIYHLASCTTCKKIIAAIDPDPTFELQDIKTTALTPEALEEMQKHSGSYEALFSKRAQLYKQRELKNQDLTEEHYKALILEHYTFLKRPVVIHNDEIFIGNAKKTVAAAIRSLQ